MEGVYSIKDEVMEHYSDMIIIKNDKAALRIYKQAIEKSQFKNDLKLYKIGNYESKTAQLTPIKPKLVKEEEKNGIFNRLFKKAKTKK